MRCQAYTKLGEPCKRDATHEHSTQASITVHVCGTHLRYLRKRERLGSVPEALRDWKLVGV